MPQRRSASVVEVFPPNFSLDEKLEPVIGLRQKRRDFLERVKRIQHLADSVLIADVKDAGRLKLSSVYSAAFLREESGIDAIPVVTARDSNRPAILSMVATALSSGLTGVMLVWGDRYGEGDGAKNVYNYPSVSALLADARALARRAAVRCRLFAPVDLTALSTEKGIRLARERLRSGADVLLAQPPTADASGTLPSHAKILAAAGLRDRVMLNVFPFRDAPDIEACRGKFGWELPQRLDRIAAGGEKALLKEARRVAEGIRGGGFAGVYVSTRGRPELARFILD